MRVPTLDIVIVNWNTGPMLSECVQSIARAQTKGFCLERVVVVDNASADRSADALPGAQLPLSLVRNGENRGFGAACNQGAQGSASDYLLFLNPDTRLEPDSLAAPIALLEDAEHGDIAVCGIQLLDEQGRVSRSCARFPTPAAFWVHLSGLDRMAPRFFRSHHLRDWDHAQSRSVDHVIGAFYLMRRAVFDELGGFDERFFVYLEDLDLSWRVAHSGRHSMYLAGARAWHVGGGSSEAVRGRRLFYALRSRILFGFKYFNIAQAVALLVGTLVLEPLARLAQAAVRLRPADIGPTLQGFYLLWRDLPALLAVVRRGNGGSARGAA